MPVKDIGLQYDKIAEQFEDKRSPTIGLCYVNQLLSYIKSKEATPDVKILDIGCGTGLPLTKHIASRYKRVTGIDISEQMLHTAKNHVPDATFVTADMTTYTSQEKYHAILAWDSLFHVSISRQEDTLRHIISLLHKDGVFLFTTGGKHGQLTDYMFGQLFPYYSLSQEQYMEILTEEKCDILINECDDPSSHGHRVFCCRKRITNT
ncbi:class I SAM-dependent methyltransferase [Gracilibacillus sp. YIM 98692]|uniref:class I SAM-dependent methyltransferase n=1 Tax=Gracilibacillus sp. YIM 98692 TaxID=2663532 RepID=UPI0013D477C9|nr:class I SAM-dependent methyltransferase [Gracilibacillus sp. YIM 98692]